MREKALVFESLAAGFYVNVTRSLAPIFMAAIGMSIKEIVLLNLYSYSLAFLFSALLFRFRKILLRELKKSLLIFHVLERFFWCSLPVAYGLGILPVAYALAVTFSAPTSALITAHIHSIDDVELKKRVLYYRSALGALSNLVGSATTMTLLFLLEGKEKYALLFLLALFSGVTSSALVSTIQRRALRISEPGEEVKVKYVNVLLFVLFLNSSSAIIGAAWTPYLMIELNSPDYLAAAIGTAQTIASIVSPLFWAKRSYGSYRFAVLSLSAFPFLIYTLKNPEVHVALAFVYAFLLSAANVLSSFLFAELSEAKDRLAFLSTIAATLSQLLGMGLAALVGELGLIFATSSVLLISSLALTFFTIPETAIDAEKARIYSRVVYATTIQGYSFSIYVSREVSLLTLRMFALVLIILVLTFLYRFAYYLGV